MAGAKIFFKFKQTVSRNERMYKTITTPPSHILNSANIVRQCASGLGRVRKMRTTTTLCGGAARRTHNKYPVAVACCCCYLGLLICGTWCFICYPNHRGIDNSDTYLTKNDDVHGFKANVTVDVRTNISCVFLNMHFCFDREKMLYICVFIWLNAY
jgi:hypothetical protein